jgi:hypothetical protein
VDVIRIAVAIVGVLSLASCDSQAHVGIADRLHDRCFALCQRALTVCHFPIDSCEELCTIDSEQVRCAAQMDALFDCNEAAPDAAYCVATNPQCSPQEEAVRDCGALADGGVGDASTP